MASLEFPISPIVGQVYSAGSKVWQWNGTGWVLAGGALNSGAPAGTLTLIETKTISSAVAQVDFTTGIDSRFDEYEIHALGIRVSTDTGLVLRVSSDGGASWKVGATDYQWAFYSANVGAAGAPAGGSSSSIALGNAIWAGASHASANYRIWFAHPSSTTLRKMFRGQGVHNNPTTFQQVDLCGMVSADTLALNGVRILTNSGNFIAGTFALYGVLKTPITPSIAAAPAGSQILIRSQTVTTPVANIDFTSGIDSTYDEYELAVIGFRSVSGDQALAMQVSQDSGATWISTSYQYGFSILASTGSWTPVQVAGASMIQMMGGQNSATTAAPASGRIKMASLGATGGMKMIRYEFAQHHASLSFAYVAGVGGVPVTTGVMNGVRLLCTGSVNIAAGAIFNLYGIKK